VNSDTIKRYLSENRVILPVKPGEKAPRFKNWSQAIPTETDFADGDNLAERLDNIVDVDCDSTETRALAKRFLVGTRRVHGRPSLGPSHYWYDAPGSTYEKFTDFDGKPLVEIRTGNTHYTLIPPSVLMTKDANPVPETLKWFEDGAPGRVDAAALRVNVCLIAAGALLCRSWPTGNRHNTTLAIAGLMATLDISQKATEELLLGVTEYCEGDEWDEVYDTVGHTYGEKQKGQPFTGGLKLAELIDNGTEVVKRIRKWLGRSEPSEFPNTEDGDARFFAHRNADRVRFDHRRGRWLLLSETGLWVPDQVQGVTRLAADAMRERQQIANAIQDREDRTKAWTWAFKGESRSRLSNTLALAQSIAPLADAGDEWDTDASLLGVPNGVVDLRTGTLRQARPEDRITLCAGIEYEPGATSALWADALRDIFVDPALIDFFQVAAGYSATGDTRRDCWFLASGSGRNGKGTVYNAIRRALGDYALELPASIFDRRKDNASYDLALLPGKRFVTSSESGDTIHLNHDRIKQLTGGDPIRAANKYEKSFEFDPTCKVWLACNKKPRVTDDTVGFWERVFLIPFEQSFVGRENRDLRPSLEHDPVHQRAVLAWIVAGAKRYYERGLEPPAVVKQATAQYRKDSSPLTDFLDECCIVQEGAEIQASTLFKAYQRWAQTNGLRYPLTLKSFGLEVKAQFACKQVNGVNRYQGVGLIDPQLPSPEETQDLYADSQF
jgi:P4 family phage/plasmid primase-like protien